MSARIAVFASGGGTNLQALLDRFNTSTLLAGRVMLVISDRADAAALRRAANAGVMTRVVPVNGRAADDVANETLEALRDERIDLICLAGYLRLIPTAVIDAFRGRIVNIHPALLPAFGGQGMYGSRVHDAVISAGCMISGPTVHYVTENYDEGRIIAQWPVPVLPGDDTDRLAKRVLRAEHMLYPAAVEAVLRRMQRADDDAAPASDDDAMVRDELKFELRLPDASPIPYIFNP
jgi:phosphoribosylglycinamide formyltransferase/phosphoribosylglycinamide formyltransferase-1